MSRYTVTRFTIDLSSCGRGCIEVGLYIVTYVQFLCTEIHRISFPWTTELLVECRTLWGDTE